MPAGANRALVGVLNSTTPESHVSLFELPFAGQGESQVTLKLEMDALKRKLRVILETKGNSNTIEDED